MVHYQPHLRRPPPPPTYVGYDETGLSLPSSFNGLHRFPDQLAQQYDLLSLPDIYALIAYRLRHQTEVMHYLAEINVRAAEVRRKIEELRGPQPTKAEFLARVAAREKAG